MLTTIELSNEDAALFLEFQRRYAMIRLLVTIGAFDIKSGSITIHFANTGEVMSVDKVQHHRI